MEVKFVFYCSVIISIIFIKMNSLKNALGKQTENDEASMSRSNASKIYNKSKNGSIWALDPDEDETQQQKDKDQSKYKDFEAKILAAYEKDSNFTEIGFFEIIEQIQNASEELDQLQRLLLIQKSANSIQVTKDQNLSTYVSAFLECLIRRIKKLKKKEKKIELQEYQKIVKTNFKKKSGAQYIDEANLDGKGEVKKNTIMRNNGNARYNSKSIEGSSSKQNGSASSTQGKLGKLISSGVLKEQKKQQQNEQNQDHKQESVSFSAVISQSSIATRQRKPRDAKTKKEKQVKPVQKQQQGQAQGNDEAFIFYRPKAGKKI